MTHFLTISILQTISWPGELNTGGRGGKEERNASESSVTVMSQHTNHHAVSPHSKVVSQCLLATGYQSANQLSEDQKS